MIEILEDLDLLSWPSLDLSGIEVNGIALGAPASVVPRRRLVGGMSSVVVRYRGGTDAEGEYYAADGRRLTLDEVVDDVVRSDGFLYGTDQINYKVRAGSVVGIAISGPHLAHFAHLTSYEEFLTVFGRPDRMHEKEAYGDLMSYETYYWGARKHVTWDVWENRVSFVNLGDFEGNSGDVGHDLTPRLLARTHRRKRSGSRTVPSCYASANQGALGPVGRRARPVGPGGHGDGQVPVRAAAARAASRAGFRGLSGAIRPAPARACCDGTTTPLDHGPGRHVVTCPSDTEENRPMDRTGRPERRSLLAGGLAGAVVALAGCSSTRATPSAAGASPEARPTTPATAFARLMEGNKRWVGGDLQHPDRDPNRRQLVAQEQEPFGSVLSCIDSRVPPELLFDTGLGDLYVMRTGGEAVGPVVTGSVEYGPMTSGTPLVVILGHQRCGAVKAAYASLRDGKPLPGNLQAIAEALRPAYEQAVREGGANPVETMARAQVTLTAADLRSNQDLAPLVKKGALAVVGAYYSLDTGKVEVLAGAPVG